MAPTRVTAAALAALAALPLAGCTTVCPAVGYVYNGPAVVDLADPLPADGELAACFGTTCEPAAVERHDGTRWFVPQEAPYVPDETRVPGEWRQLRVVVSGAAGVIDDRVHEIPLRIEQTGVFGQCPGPFSYEPIPLDLKG